MKTKDSSRKRILKALMEGRRLTSYEANGIGKTTEGGRRLRQLCETYPIIKESIPGEAYKVYYIDPEWLAQYRKEHKKPLSERVGDFFGNLFDGLFGGCR